MNEELTPEQKAYLETWAGQRDLMNAEISALATQKEKLEEAIKTSSESLSDVETRANETIGRIEELLKKEKEMYLMTPKEVVDLRVEKTGLQVEVSGLKLERDGLLGQKECLQRDISTATKTLSAMNDRTNSMEKVIEHVTASSRQNSEEITQLVTDLKTSLGDLVAVNNKNVTSTNEVLDKLPKMLMELQKAKLIKNKIL